MRAAVDCSSLSGRVWHWFLIWNLAGLSASDLLLKLTLRALMAKRLLHPWVRTNLRNGGPLRWVVLQQRQHQVLELRRQVLSVNFVEIQSVLASHEQIEEVLLLACLLERENSVCHHEQYHTEGKHIHLRSVVDLALLDLRCHVGEGSTVTLEIVQLLVACETVIEQLDVRLEVKDNVLKF